VSKAFIDLAWRFSFLFVAFHSPDPPTRNGASSYGCPVMKAFRCFLEKSSVLTSPVIGVLFLVKVFSYDRSSASFLPFWHDCGWEWRFVADDGFALFWRVVLVDLANRDLELLLVFEFPLGNVRGGSFSSFFPNPPCPGVVIFFFPPPPRDRMPPLFTIQMLSIFFPKLLFLSFFLEIRKAPFPPLLGFCIPSISL